jgi:hypothetical protein
MSHPVPAIAPQIAGFKFKFTHPKTFASQSVAQCIFQKSSNKKSPTTFTSPLVFSALSASSALNLLSSPST